MLFFGVYTAHFSCYLVIISTKALLRALWMLLLIGSRSAAYRCQQHPIAVYTPPHLTRCGYITKKRPLTEALLSKISFIRLYNCHSEVLRHFRLVLLRCHTGIFSKTLVITSINNGAAGVYKQTNILIQPLL